MSHRPGIMFGMDQSMRRSLGSLAQLQQILVNVLDRVAETRATVGYRLVGTSAALLQGVPVDAGDIDILVARRIEVDTIAAALSPFTCRTAPEWLPDARQYFARYLVDDIDVEISTVEWPTNFDTVECIGTGPWRHYVSVACGTHNVPAVRLELRLVTELIRDRPDRATALIAHLRSQGADFGLLRESMTDRAVPSDQRRRILDELQSGIRS
jgi:hypothetical protein